jgi:hypothetical protein
MGRAGGDLLDVVRDDDRRREIPPGVESSQQGRELLPGAEIEAGGRLVEQQEFWIEHQRAGDLDALSLAR